jgi:predicted DNA-binding transcriptional regulator AlpA
MTKALEALASLPPFAVLTKKETAQVTSLSEDALDRLHQRSLGPKRVQLSERRVGYQVAELTEWLRQRSS